jgi:hypothetical protein
MSDSCPKCGGWHEVRLAGELSSCLKAQLAAATKRAEEAEQENARLRGKIEALATITHPYCNLEINASWLAEELAALLAQPEGE